MKYIRFHAKGKNAAEVLAMLGDNERVNRGVSFGGDGSVPLMRLTEKGGRVRILCERIGGASRDNGFLVGTYFTGRITEKEGRTTLSGVVLTAPIYHMILFALFAFFIVQCVVRQAFSPLPICLVVFDLFLFWKEFQKQGDIARYIARAFRRLLSSDEK